MKKELRLGDILVERSLISEGDLARALEEQKRTREFLGLILLKRSLIKEKDLLKALSEQLNIPFISLQYRYMHWDFIKGFNQSLILDYKCFPVERDDHSITIAITNPLDAWVIGKAEEEVMPYRLKLALVTRDDMEKAILRYKEYVQQKYF
ncbi:MAG: hypothetical protein ABIG92_03600 [Candidatus Omnitrophota bacterium]